MVVAILDNNQLVAMVESELLYGARISRDRAWALTLGYVPVIFSLFFNSIRNPLGSNGIRLAPQPSVVVNQSPNNN